MSVISRVRFVNLNEFSGFLFMMKIELGVLVILTIGSSSLGSVFQVIHKPESVTLPEEASFPLSDVPLVVRQLLGLGTEKVRILNAL